MDAIPEGATDVWGVAPNCRPPGCATDTVSCEKKRVYDINTSVFLIKKSISQAGE